MSITPTYLAKLPGDLRCVEGPDAADFLNRLLTLNCKSLAVGCPSRAFLLTARGKVTVALEILRTAADRFWLAGDGLLIDTTLDHYHFGERLTVSALESHRRARLMGAAAEDVLAKAGLHSTQAWCDGLDAAILPGTFWTGPSFDLWVRQDIEDATLAALVDAGAVLLDAAQYAAARIRAGVPSMAEYSEKISPLEVGMAGISEGKGCYPGQEVIERTLALGRPARRCITVEGPVHAGATLSLADGTAVGTVTSAAAGYGLALVKFKQAEATLFCAAEGVLHPVRTRLIHEHKD